MEKITYDEFIEKYKPIDNPYVKDPPFECMYETYGGELEAVRKAKNTHVWTIVEGDSGTYLSAGYHFVNRLGYFITKHPWENELIEIDIYEEEE